MKQNDILKKIRGIWLGNYTHESKITLERILLDVIGNEFDGPIIKSDNFGQISGEVSYMVENCSKWSYATPTTGRNPENSDEIAMDTTALKLLGA